MSYRYYNANSKNNFVNDCVIRAISVAENKTWDETYDELSEIAQYNGIILDDVNFVKPLLDSRYKRLQKAAELYRNVGEFAENHPYGRYLISMNNHITCCISGYIVDTFDCRNRAIEHVWVVK